MTSAHTTTHHRPDAMTVRLAHAAVAPVTVPARHADTDIDEIRTRLDRLDKRELLITKRVKVHLTCIGTGIVISVALTFVSAPLVIHLAGFLTGLPIGIQELLDGLKRW